ncbi:MAG: large-conductance mechanosensitive channel protein MscL [Erysipelothrix sp.]
MKKFLNEFKEFAMQGNVLDMAIGVVIGGAFGKIVTSLVNDIITPLISIITGGIKLDSLKATLPNFWGAAEPVTLNYGMFLQATLDFVIIAFCIFLMIRAFNTLKRSKPEEVEVPADIEPSNEEKLLQEILNELKQK